MTAIAATTGATGHRIPFLNVLADPNYRTYWIGNTVSLAGDQFQSIALAVLALELTGSAATLGGVLLAQALPRVTLMLAGGVLADRQRPQSVMIRANLLQAMAVAALAVVVGTGHVQVWHLYVYAVVAGTLFAFAQPAGDAFVPQIVPRHHLRTANALNSLSLNLAMSVVPPLAGVIVAAAGSLPSLIINGASFLVAATAARLVIVPQHIRPPALRANPWHDLRAGIDAARSDNVLWLTIVIAAFYSVGALGASQVGLPAFAKLTLEAGSEGVGILFGASGVGAVAGAIIVGMIPTPRRPGIMAGASLLVMGVSIALVAVAPGIWAAVPLLLVFGVGRGFCANTFVTLVQTRSPDVYRGRILAMFKMSASGLAPLSLALAGVLADMFGPRVAIAAGGCAVALSGLYAFTRHEFRRARPVL